MAVPSFIPSSPYTRDWTQVSGLTVNASNPSPTKLPSGSPVKLLLLLGLLFADWKRNHERIQNTHKWCHSFVGLIFQRLAKALVLTWLFLYGGETFSYTCSPLLQAKIWCKVIISNTLFPWFPMVLFSQCRIPRVFTDKCFCFWRYKEPPELNNPMQNTLSDSRSEESTLWVLESLVFRGETSTLLMSLLLFDWLESVPYPQDPQEWTLWDLYPTHLQNRRIPLHCTTLLFGLPGLWDAQQHYGSSHTPSHLLTPWA